MQFELSAFLRCPIGPIILVYNMCRGCTKPVFFSIFNFDRVFREFPPKIGSSKVHHKWFRLLGKDTNAFLNTPRVVARPENPWPRIHHVSCMYQLYH